LDLKRRIHYGRQAGWLQIGLGAELDQHLRGQGLGIDIDDRMRNQ
jgi:hypothetical protein